MVGPFSTPDYARGGYAVALTLACFANLQGEYANEMTFATGLELMRSEERAETDFVAWLADRRYRRLPREPEMVIGECKSYAQDAFTDDDIRRLKTLGEWFPGAFIVAACLKNKLSPDEVGRLRGLATWGWSRESIGGEPSRIIVLTGAELFSGSVRDGWEKAGGQLADLWLHGPASILRHLPFATQEAHLVYVNRRAESSVSTRTQPVPINDQVTFNFNGNGRRPFRQCGNSITAGNTCYAITCPREQGDARLSVHEVAKARRSAPPQHAKC